MRNLVLFALVAITCNFADASIEQEKIECEHKNIFSCKRLHMHMKLLLMLNKIIKKLLNIMSELVH